MPIPKPQPGEGESAFLRRCMADRTMQAEYPDSGQRFAVCEAQLGTTRELKQAGVRADLRRKLALEKKLLQALEPYHRTLVREFTRRLGAPGSTRGHDQDLATLLRRHYERTQALFGQDITRRLPRDVAATPEEEAAIAAALATYFATQATNRAADINRTTDQDMATAQRLAAADQPPDQPPLSPQELAVVGAAILHRQLRGRAVSIATTETQLAAEATKATQAEVLSGVQPTVSGGGQRPAPATKRWDSVGDSHVRDDHLAADGQEVAVAEAFVVGGEQLMYPGDTSLGASPGNVINCRCSATYDTQEIAEQRRG